MKAVFRVAASVALTLQAGCSRSPEPLPDAKIEPKSGEYRPYTQGESKVETPKKGKDAQSP